MLTRRSYKKGPKTKKVPKKRPKKGLRPKSKKAPKRGLRPKSKGPKKGLRPKSKKPSGKKKIRFGLRSSARISTWAEAMGMARKNLNLVGFVPCGGNTSKGQELYNATRELYDSRL